MYKSRVITLRAEANQLPISALRVILSEQTQINYQSLPHKLLFPRRDHNAQSQTSEILPNVNKLAGIQNPEIIPPHRRFFSHKHRNPFPIRFCPLPVAQNPFLLNFFQFQPFQARWTASAYPGRERHTGPLQQLVTRALLSSNPHLL